MRYTAKKLRSSGKSIVLNYLSDLMGHVKKHYCYPSQDTILTVLRERYGYQIARRQLNYILADLEAMGYIKRVRRHKMDADGNLIFRSTLYVMLKKGWTFIKAIQNLFNGQSANFNRSKNGRGPVDLPAAKRTGPTALKDILADNLGLKFT